MKFTIYFILLSGILFPVNAWAITSLQQIQDGADALEQQFYQTPVNDRPEQFSKIFDSIFTAPNSLESLPNKIIAAQFVVQFFNTSAVDDTLIQRTMNWIADSAIPSIISEEEEVNQDRYKILESLISSLTVPQNSHSQVKIISILSQNKDFRVKELAATALLNTRSLDLEELYIKFKSWRMVNKAAFLSALAQKDLVHFGDAKFAFWEYSLNHRDKDFSAYACSLLIDNVVRHNGSYTMIAYLQGTGKLKLVRIMSMIPSQRTFLYRGKLRSLNVIASLAILACIDLIASSPLPLPIKRTEIDTNLKAFPCFILNGRTTFDNPFLTSP